MRYAVVLALSLLAGAAAYAATLRAGREDAVALGFGDEPDPDAAEGSSRAGGPGPGYAYLRVETTGPSWRDRVQGFVGLVVLVSVGAAILALAIYQVGHLINQTIERFLGP